MEPIELVKLIELRKSILTEYRGSYIVNNTPLLTPRTLFSFVLKRV